MTKISSNKKLQEGILNGVLKLDAAVGDTLGPYGRTVLVKDQYGKRKATKDGVSVAKAFLELENDVEDYGAQMVKEVSIKSANENGDGTTTATVLATSIIENGFKAMNNGSNAIQVKKGIDDAVKQIINNLETIKIDITEDHEIEEVATISGNNDIEIGKLIATAINKVGREGIVSIEKSKTHETSLDVVEGMQFDRGYKSPYFVTDNNTMQVTLEKPLILIYNGRITSAQDVVGVMNKANTEQKTLLIIAEDIEGEALSTLIVNKMRGIVNSVAVKAPDFGDRRTAILEDLAVVVGGQVISLEKGHKLDKLTDYEFDKFLGTSRTATISKDKTTIVDGDCTGESITKRADELKTQIDNAASMFEKEKLQERLGRLIGGVAVISVGGNSELEIDEKKDRVDDALYATKSALEEGILPGGGSALLYAIQNLKFSDDKDIRLGQEILQDACVTPFTRILLNAGYEIDKIQSIYDKLVGITRRNKTLLEKIMYWTKPTLSKRSNPKNLWDGYDLRSESIVDMKEKGILDPMKVTKGALLNASSIAGTILTTNTLVYEAKESIKEEPQQMY